jgi:RimJ/RimL family protein N-acetyltransferase
MRCDSIALTSLRLLDADAVAAPRSRKPRQVSPDRGEVRPIPGFSGLPAGEDVSGHIGYDVRPNARRQGHATAMLAAALPVANALGIDGAVLTCDETNIASRRVIEAYGGRYVDTVDIKRRYLVPTFVWGRCRSQTHHPRDSRA